MITTDRKSNALLTIAYKNKNFEFVDFTPSLLSHTGINNENKLLGKTDYDLCCNYYADEYRRHDVDALCGKVYSAIVPFIGHNGQLSIVLCTRYQRKNNKNEIIGVACYVVSIINPDVYLLRQNIIKNNKLSNESHLYLNKSDDINLTAKEKECLFYLLQGKTAKVIANAMCISYRTVEYHVDNLKIKFDCKTKNELLCKAMQYGYANNLPHADVASLAKGVKC